MIYFRLVYISIRAQMAYKFNFFVSNLTQAVFSAMDFILIATILVKFNNINNWTIYEIGFLYAIATASSSIYRVFGNEIHNFDKYIVQGELDQLLTKPISPLTLLLTKNLYLTQLGGLIQGGIIMGISLYGLWQDEMKLLLISLYIPVALFTGTIIIFSIGLLTATLSFWTGKISSLQGFTMHAPRAAGNFPMDIYPFWLKSFLFTIFPVAFMAYVPSLFLFDKGGYIIFLFISPLIAVCMLYISILFWNFGIKKYQSSGT